MSSSSSLSSASSSIWQKELIPLVDLAWPSVLINFSVIGIGLVNSVVVGRFSTDAFAGVAFGDVVMETTLVIIMQGFGMGLRTMCAQAFGAREFLLVGQYTQMSLVAISLLCIPLGFIWGSVGWVLQFTNAEEEVVQYASLYGRVALFSLWPRTIYAVLRTYFTAQHIVLPTAFFSIISLVCHALLSWILVHGVGFWSGIGFVGCPVSISVVSWIRLIFYWYYMFHHRKLHIHTWPSCWVDSWSHCKTLLRVGMPLMIGIAIQNAQMLVATLMASLLGTAPLAAHTAMVQLLLSCSCPTNGLVNAATTRIGYYLGAGKPELSKLVSQLLLGCTMIWCALVIIVYSNKRAGIGSLFTKDENVVAEINSISPVTVVGYSFLSIFYFAMGTLVGQGRSIWIMIAFGTGSWIVGIPTAYYFAFIHPGNGLVGIWIGLALGFFVTTCISLYAVSHSSWTEIAVLAQKRVQGGSIRGQGSIPEKEQLLPPP